MQDEINWLGKLALQIGQELDVPLNVRGAEWLPETNIRMPALFEILNQAPESIPSENRAFSAKWTEAALVLLPADVQNEARLPDMALVFATIRR